MENSTKIIIGIVIAIVLVIITWLILKWRADKIKEEKAAADAAQKAKVAADTAAAAAELQRQANAKTVEETLV